MSLVLDKIQDYLLDYQLDWLKDQSTYKAVIKSRQIGYTHVCGLEILLHAIKHSGHTCICVSTSQTNAIAQIMSRVRWWMERLKLDPDFKEYFNLQKDTQSEIVLANGSIIKAAANEPDRLRGNDKSSYWMDEAAFWSQRIHDGIESAVLPQINKWNPNGVIRIISTPGTMGDNLFYQIVESARQNQGTYKHWSLHQTDIYEAVAAGCPVDIDKERAKTRADIWRQEYECQFLAIGSGYFDRQTLLNCLTQEDGTGSVYIGIDLGKVNDFTSIVIIKEHNGIYTVVATYMMRSVDYAQQAQVIESVIEAWDPHKVEVDTTAHQGFGDLLRERVDSADIIEDRRFTHSWKTTHTENLREIIEADNLLVRSDSYTRDASTSSWDKATQGSVLIDDLSRVKQVETASGKITYRVARDKELGHGDSYSALLCALSASQKSGWAFV